MVEKAHEVEVEMPGTIAIDGPAGAGKSTIGRLLAERLGSLFLDTGAMYRAVALAALREGISTTNEPRLADLAEHLPIHIKRPRRGETDGRPYTVMVGDEDVTWEIRKPAVESVVSAIASWPSVRTQLVRQQRRMAGLGPVVMVGRDITTEVLPDADLKIYLDASLQERARRRYVELQERGREVSYEQVEAEIADRDSQDMHRAAGALRQAEDAIVVNTEGLTIEESLDMIMDVVRGWKKREK
ncbi:MAG TPA: (d)CMP kinase [Chloroflexia bacterium]|nr:(d)CMP kinase [Chloroflexia bacterium]